MITSKTQCPFACKNSVLLFAVGGGIALFLFASLDAVNVGRAFFYDGAFWIANNLNSDMSEWPHYNDPKHNRLFVQLLNQLPFSIAVHLGLRDVDTLQWLFGFGFFFVPIFVYAFTFYVLVKNNSAALIPIIIASIIICALPSYIFIVNPAFTTVSLYWLLFSYAICVRNFSKLDALVIIVASVVLLSSYELSTLFGPFLALIAAIRFYKDGFAAKALDNISLIAIILGGVGTALTNLIWKHYHNLSSETSNFISLVSNFPVARLRDSSITITIVFAATYFLVLGMSLFYKIIGKKGGRSYYWMSRIIAGLGGLFVLVLSIRMIGRPLSISPWAEYQDRILLFVGPPGFFLISWFMHTYFRDVLHKAVAPSLLILAPALCGASLLQLNHNFGWEKFSEELHFVLSSSEPGFIGLGSVQQHFESIGHPYLYWYGYDWTWPSLSVLIHHEPYVSTVILPEPTSPQPYLNCEVSGGALEVPFGTLREGLYFQFDPLFETECR